MLTYSFTNLKNESLYMHLYQCIRQDIVDGKLVSGEKLPSKRSFAKNLGLSTITNENEYAQLLVYMFIGLCIVIIAYSSILRQDAKFLFNILKR